MIQLMIIIQIIIQSCLQKWTSISQLNDADKKLQKQHSIQVGGIIQLMIIQIIACLQKLTSISQLRSYRSNVLYPGG